MVYSRIFKFLYAENLCVPYDRKKSVLQSQKRIISRTTNINTENYKGAENDEITGKNGTAEKRNQKN